MSGWAKARQISGGLQRKEADGMTEAQMDKREMERVEG